MDKKELGEILNEIVKDIVRREEKGSRMYCLGDNTLAEHDIRTALEILCDPTKTDKLTDDALRDINATLRNVNTLLHNELKKHFDKEEI